MLNEPLKTAPIIESFSSSSQCLGGMLFLGKIAGNRRDPCLGPAIPREWRVEGNTSSCWGSAPKSNNFFDHLSLTAFHGSLESASIHCLVN